jgi:hypothetical protein
MPDTIDVIASVRSSLERQKESLARYQSGQFKLSEAEQATGRTCDVTSEHIETLKRAIAEYELVLNQLIQSAVPES